MDYMDYEQIIKHELTWVDREVIADVMEEEEWTLSDKRLSSYSRKQINAVQWWLRQPWNRRYAMVGVLQTDDGFEIYIEDEDEFGIDDELWSWC